MAKTNAERQQKYRKDHKEDIRAARRAARIPVDLRRNLARRLRALGATYRRGDKRAVFTLNGMLQEELEEAGYTWDQLLGVEKTS